MTERWDANGMPIFKRPVIPTCEHGFNHPPWAHACDGCTHETDRRT